VISAGEGDGSSANYDLISVVGQPSPLEFSSSSNYVNYPGFMYTLLGAPEQIAPITLQSPPDGSVFNTCSLIKTYQPLFQWIAAEPFRKYSLLFSISSTDFAAPITKATIEGTQNDWTPSAAAWKKIMKSSYNNGSIREIYWILIGTRSDNTTSESEVRSLRVGASQAVTINTPADGAALPAAELPTFSMNPNCNTKFRLEFSSFESFGDPAKIKRFNSTVRNPNVDTSLQKILTYSQWTSVKTLVGTGTGYFRIKAWDGIKRETVSETRFFIVR
jgi:hypothetical protein